MPHSRTTEILRSAADRFDHERLVTVHEWIKRHIGDYGADLCRPTAMTEIRTGGDSIGGGTDLGTLAEGIYRIDHHSAKSEYLLKAPAMWLLQSLWWTLHAELRPEWLDQRYCMLESRRLGDEGLYTADLIDITEKLFRRYTTTHGVLVLHLVATYHPDDRMSLLAGVPWATGHLSWPATVLHYAEHPDEAGQGHVSMPEGMAAYLLSDLHEEWLAGPWHEWDERQARLAEMRIRERTERVPSDGQETEEDGGQGTEGEG